MVTPAPFVAAPTSAQIPAPGPAPAPPTSTKKSLNFSAKAFVPSCKSFLMCRLLK
jgi:hypothetical protein